MMSDIKCTRCNNYRKDFNSSRNQFVHSCTKHKAFTVYGELSETVKPDCLDGDFFAWPKIESLKEKTFRVAGGKYDRATERERSNLKDITGWKPLKRSGWMNERARG